MVKKAAAAAANVLDKTAGELGRLLAGRARADQVYRLTCVIENLHAVQGRNDTTLPLGKVTVNETADSEFGAGTPEGEMSSPASRRRTKKTTKEKDCPAYQFERNGVPNAVLLELGGPYGLFGKALRDAIVSMNKAKYWLPTSTLISFEPVEGINTRYKEVPVEYTTFNSLDEDPALPPKPRMEPRKKPGGDQVMVPVFHERIPGQITVLVDMIVNAECPRTMVEIAGILHAMQGIPFGPAKRGRIRSITAERIK